MILVVLEWSCKENPKQKEQKMETVEQEIPTTKLVPESIKEIAAFAIPTFSDSTNINDLMVFKELDVTSNVITIIEMDRAGDLYKKLASRGQATSLPIFEIKDTDLVVLTTQGTGFGGAIWAKVLLDKKTMEIKSIAFEHNAESEGYGAAIVQSTFEDQFVGKKISFEEDTFTLQKAIEKANDDGHFIEGVSGATMTSQGALAMMNESLRKYKSYLEGDGKVSGSNK